jgi:hypothetical protein
MKKFGWKKILQSHFSLLVLELGPACVSLSVLLPRATGQRWSPKTLTMPLPSVLFISLISINFVSSNVAQYAQTKEMVEVMVRCYKINRSKY